MVIRRTCILTQMITTLYTTDTSWYLYYHKFSSLSYFKPYVVAYLLSLILRPTHSKMGNVYPLNIAFTNNILPASDSSCAICCWRLSFSFFSWSHDSSSSRHRCWTSLDEVSSSRSDFRASAFAVCACSNWLSSSASVVSSFSVHPVSRWLISKQRTHRCLHCVIRKWNRVGKNCNFKQNRCNFLDKIANCQPNSIRLRLNDSVNVLWTAKFYENFTSLGAIDPEILWQVFSWTETHWTRTLRESLVTLVTSSAWWKILLFTHDCSFESLKHVKRLFTLSLQHFMPL